MGSPSEDNYTRSGPAFGSVGSVVFLKGLGGVAPTYGFNRNPFTFCGRTSLVSVPSVNVPFSAAIIQYGPVLRKRSFPHARLEHEHSLSYCEQFFVSPAVSIHESSMALLVQFKDRQAMDLRFAESEDLL